MKEHFRGVVWPRSQIDDKDGSPAYRYTIVGLLTTDTPIEGLDPNETVIDGLFERHVEEMGMAGALERAQKFEAAYRFGDANSVLTNLNSIVGKPLRQKRIKPLRKKHNEDSGLVREDSAATDVITIMPDYGNSPYAWLKPASDITSSVGVNVGGFLSKPSDFEISGDLHDDFVSWCSVFERDAGTESFDWVGFHAVGMVLARELKGQVGPKFRVMYSKPVEDPAHDVSPVTEIL